MKQLFSVFATFIFVMTSMAPVATSAAPTSAFNAGDLVKGSNPAVYYFASNGKRYVFPNDKTYFTWYTNFNTVKTIPDYQLSNIPLGGNVTYRPGYKMVKVTTDPRVYVVDQGGVLRHVSAEQLAQSLYGLSWKNQIDDVPDAFFVNYRVGSAIELAADFRPSNVMTATQTINQDKQIDETSVSIGIGNIQTSFVPTTITIKRGSSVTWTNRDIAEHSVVGSGWASSLLRPNQTYTRTFSTAGSFEYQCGIHPTMRGTINVVN